MGCQLIDCMPEPVSDIHAFLSRRCLTPKLESSMGLRDTCGVHNLHGMLGLLGGLTAASVSLTSNGGNQGVMPARHHQAWYQVFGILVTLGIAAGGGMVATTAVKTATPSVHKLQTEHLLDDSMWWNEIEEGEQLKCSVLRRHR